MESKMENRPETVGNSRDYEPKAQAQSLGLEKANTPMREMTVAEFLNQRQWELEMKLRGIQRLREGVSVGFLQMPSSYIQGLLKD